MAHGRQKDRDLRRKHLKKKRRVKEKKTAAAQAKVTVKA